MVYKHKMFIELDRDKIEREKKYDYIDMIRIIDNVFAERNIKKNGEGLYEGGSFVSLIPIVRFLSQNDWFLDNAKTWLWYELEKEIEHPNDDDYSVEDLLLEYRESINKQMVG